MQVKGIKVIVVAIVIAVTLGLLFGANFVHEKFNIEKPLFKLYSDTKLVSNPDIVKQDDITTIKVTINKTDNMYKVYQDLVKDTEEVLGNKQFEIVVNDDRSPELEEAYYKSQFVIFEAIAKGSYTEIPVEILENANAIGAKAKVNIDEKNIYVAIYKGDKYLYEIIPREDNKISTSVADRMGSDK